MHQGHQGFSNSQHFNPDPNISYEIASAKDNKFVLDASQDKKHFNELIIWENHQGSNQKWRFVSNGDGTFLIKSAETGGTLGISEKKDKIGSQPLVGYQNGTNNEKRRIVPTGNGKGFIFESMLNGLVLDIAQSKMKNGTEVIIYSNRNQDNQTWSIVPT